jgi:hypothetical protein
MTNDTIAYNTHSKKINTQYQNIGVVQNLQISFLKVLLALTE